MDIKKLYFVHIRNPRDGRYYTSYDDYFRLVHISGFQECDIEQVDPMSDNTYIFTLNYHGFGQGPIPDEILQPGKRRARMILHQLERFNLIDERYDEIWLSDRSMKELAHPKAKYVVLGGDRNMMQKLHGIEQRFDFYHASYPYPRRQPMYDQLAQQGYIIAPSPLDFTTKNLFLQQSRVGLALHQHDHSLDYIEPLRLTLYSCYQLPILAERSNDFYPYNVYPWEKFLSGEIPIDYIDMWEHNWYTFTEQFTFKSEIIKALQ